VGSSVTSDVEKDEKIVNPPPSIHSSFLDPPSNMDEEKVSSVQSVPSLFSTYGPYFTCFLVFMKSRSTTGRSLLLVGGLSHPTWTRTKAS
jgi:hypothetical protein